jgi:hypothetical protein
MNGVVGVRQRMALMCAEAAKQRPFRSEQFQTVVLNANNLQLLVEGAHVPGRDRDGGSRLAETGRKGPPSSHQQTDATTRQ